VGEAADALWAFAFRASRLNGALVCASAPTNPAPMAGLEFPLSPLLGISGCRFATNAEERLSVQEGLEAYTIGLLMPCSQRGFVERNIQAGMLSGPD